MKQLKELYPAVAFGTSGVRALVTDLTWPVVSSYVRAFVGRMQASGELRPGAPITVGIDLRPSSREIASHIGLALQRLGQMVEFLGSVPTPALALRCLQARMHGIMVTGSHIPFDRNGIKFYSQAYALPVADNAARDAYSSRYVNYFGAAALQGMRVGLYEHSAVGRDLTREVLAGFGATVVSLGRSDAFVPIDTEAVSEADLNQARRWCSTHQLDALVSTDGDGDRPLVFDERGGFVRGDLLGLLCARRLGLRYLAVPVSCNTALVRCGVFDRVLRTRIGSPYVIAGMNALAAHGCDGIAGFEANGGFLLGTSVAGLSALPTRDALLPMLAILASAVAQRQTVSTLVESLPSRVTHSDRIKEVPTAASAALLKRLTDDTEARSSFFADTGEVTGVDTTDGLRVNFANGDIVHLRPSGNAPELRCYAEADSLDRACALVDRHLSVARQVIV